MRSVRTKDRAAACSRRLPANQRAPDTARYVQGGCAIIRSYADRCARTSPSMCGPGASDGMRSQDTALCPRARKASRMRPENSHAIRTFIRRRPQCLVTGHWAGARGDRWRTAPDGAAPRLCTRRSAQCRTIPAPAFLRPRRPCLTPKKGSSTMPPLGQPARRHQAARDSGKVATWTNSP